MALTPEQPEHEQPEHEWDVWMRLDAAGSDAHFWRNYAALKSYAVTESARSFPPTRLRVLHVLIREHWADRVLRRVPWQIREDHGISLADWRASPPAMPRRRRATQVVVPFQRSKASAEAEERLFGRFPNTNRRRERS